MAAEEEDLINRIKVWALPGIGGALMVLLSIQMNGAIKRMDDVTEKVNQIITKNEVAGAQFNYLTERVKQLEESKKEAGTVHSQLDMRLNSLEQRAALYDQYMQTHK